MHVSNGQWPSDAAAGTNDTSLYFLAACAQFKDEDSILQEWLEHYVREGVQHFYLIDDGSSDSSRPLLNPYVLRGLVTLMVDRRKDHNPPISMVERYNLLLKPFFYSSIWMLHVDLDEFMYGRSESIAQYLTSVASDIGSITVPWKHFGSSGYVKKPKGGMVQSFLWRDRHPKGTLGKTLYRTAAVRKIDVHWQHLKPGFKTGYPMPGGRMGSQSVVAESTRDLNGEQLLDQLALHLNHYRVRWRDWYVDVKMKRGIADRDVSVYDEEYFRNFDFHEVRDNELARKALYRTAH